MAFGQALFVAGDLAWNWYELQGEDPFPSVADALYLAGYPFLALGLLLLIRRRLSDGDRGGLLDAAILTAAVAILSWTFLMQPQLGRLRARPAQPGHHPRLPARRPAPHRRGDGPADDTGRPDPIVPAPRRQPRPAPRRPTRSTPSRTSTGTYVSGGPIDTLYLVAYLTFGAAVPHPSMRRLTDPHPVAVTWLGPVAAGRPGRGHADRPAARHPRPGRGRRPHRRRRSAAPSCRCSCSSAWRASSGCSSGTWRRAARSRRGSASRPSTTR